MGGAYYA
jgi:hypothetical protein